MVQVLVPMWASPPWPALAHEQEKQRESGFDLFHQTPHQGSHVWRLSLFCANKKPLRHFCGGGFVYDLVAGTGFEPVTFRL